MSRSRAIMERPEKPNRASSSSFPVSLPHRARKFSFLLVLTLVLASPIIIIPGVATNAPTVHGKELLVRVLLAFLGLALTAAWPVLRRKRISLVEGAVLAFMSAHLLSALLSGHFFYSFFESWQLWLLPGLMLVLPRLRLSQGELRAAALTIVTAAGIVAAYGYASFTGLNPLQSVYRFAFPEEGRNYMHSFLGNPEYFGSYMAPVATLCLCLALRPHAKVREAVLWAGACLVFLLAIALSGTRGAFLAFGLAALVIAWKQGRLLSRKLRRRALLAAAGGMVAATVAVVVLSTPNPLNPRNLQLAQRFALLFDLGSESVKERILFYTLAGRMIAEDPVFGAGPATYKRLFFPTLEKLVLEDPHAGVTRMASELQNRIAEHTHNDYLEVWVETGTVGFAALLLVLVAAAVCFFRGAYPVDLVTRERDVALAETLRTAFFAAALCLFANAAFSFPLHLPARATLAWVLAGLFLAADRLMGEVAETALAENKP